MKKDLNAKTFTVFGLSFVVAALTHWTIPYGELNYIENIFLLRWVLYSGLISLIGYLKFKQMAGKVAIWVASGFMISVFFRMIFDLLRDGTSHNLWPFELFLTFGLTFIPAFIVGFIYRLIQGAQKVR